MGSAPAANADRAGFLTGRRDHHSSVAGAGERVSTILRFDLGDWAGARARPSRLSAAAAWSAGEGPDPVPTAPPPPGRPVGRANSRVSGAAPLAPGWPRSMVWTASRASWQPLAAQARAPWISKFASKPKFTSKPTCSAPRNSSRVGSLVIL